MLVIWSTFLTILSKQDFWENNVQKKIVLILVNQPSLERKWLFIFINKEEKATKYVSHCQILLTSIKLIFRDTVIVAIAIYYITIFKNSTFTIEKYVLDVNQ